MKILLIDDDESLCRVMEHQLTEEGFQVKSALRGKEGLAYFKKEQFDCVITDITMPDIGGMEVLREIRTRDSQIVVILITAYGTVENAVEACQMGADEYITKPFSIEQLRFVIEKAQRFRQLEKENVSLHAQLDKRFGGAGFIGQSVPMQEVYRIIQKVAQTNTTVLIQGESGTGKELVARAIHAASSRKGHPFVPVDCAAIPENLLESELFGHIKGSFTGAIKDRKGKFETARNGTLFLDEIGDMKIELQAKLLRTLQEKQMTKVGSDSPVPVNARIIAATHRDLIRAVKNDEFRQDLYYRLAVVVIHVPPLRERMEDIEPLVNHFLEKYAGNRKLAVNKEVTKKLMAHNWPGNVRELENAIERAMVLSDGNTIHVNDIPDNFELTLPDEPLPEGGTLEEVEKRAIIRAIRKAHGNQSEAARALAIPRHVLLYRMKKWNLIVE